MRYIDGFVLVVPKKKIEIYREMAQKAGKIWKKYGALEYLECVGDDLNPNMGMLTFPEMAKAKKDEIVMFSFIMYQSREQRDEVIRKVMKDPFMKEQPKNMPFDMKKMAYGGFKAVVEE